MRMLCLLVVVFLGGLATVWAQDMDGGSPYFDCPYVNYFDEGCPQLEQEQARPEPQEQNEAEQREVEADEEEWPPDAPELLLPLFPRESLAPDTPALYRLLLMQPTLETARRYVRWHERRMERIREAQGLVEVAGRELLIERAGGGR